MKLVPFENGNWVNPDYVKSVRPCGGGSIIAIEGEDDLYVGKASHVVADMLNKANEVYEEEPK